MARRRRRRRRGSSPWRLLFILLLIAGTAYWIGRGLLSLEGRYWTAQNFWRGSPQRVKVVVEDAITEESMTLGVIAPEIELLCEPDSTGHTLCEGVVVLPAGTTLTQGNLGYTRALTGLGLHLLDGFQRSGDMVDVVFGAGKKTTVQLRLVPSAVASTDSIPGEPGQPGVPVQCRLALVIDNFGADGAESASRRFRNLSGTFTAAVHPGLEDPSAWAQEARDMGMEVILNLPLEPKGFPVRDPGKHAIQVDFSGRRIRRVFDQGLDRVGDVTGVKTYMGNLAVEDRDVMRPILEEIRDRKLFLLDTTREQYSVTSELGREIGVPVLTVWRASEVDRQYKKAAASIGLRLDSLARMSKARGYGIGIIHAQDATLEVLADRIPRWEREGIVVVGLSAVAESRRLDSHPTRDDRADN